MGKTLHKRGRWWRCPHYYNINKQCWRVSDDKGEIGRHLREKHEYSDEERKEEWRKGCPTVRAVLGKGVGRNAWKADFKAAKGQ